MEESQNTTQVQPEQLPPVYREQQEDTIDLLALFYLLWGHLLQIIACVIVGGAAAFAYTYFLVTPMYTATAKMYIATESASSLVNLDELQLGAQLTYDYRQLMYSRPLLEDAIDALDLNLSASTLGQLISIGNPSDTRILTVTITYPDPELAAEIANEVAHQATIYLPRIMEGPSLKIYEKAVAPTRKSSPSYSRNILLGAAALAVVYCGILVVLFLMDDSFKTPEDVSKYLGVQPLAVVPERNFKEKRKKCSKA